MQYFHIYHVPASFAYNLMMDIEQKMMETW